MERILLKRQNPASWLVLLLVITVQLGRAQQPSADQNAPPVISGPTPEDWSSLSLAGSQLVPEKPVFGEKADFEHFTRVLLQVRWRKGDPIDLYIIRPKGVVKPPVVLYLYSYPSETGRFRNDDYCERITAGGFAAVGFVSALTGQRYSMRPMKEWFVSEMQESLGSSVHDVQMILNFLSTQNDLDTSKVGMFATGSGATIAILAAAVDPRIQAIDLLDPWGDWPTWMAKSSIIPENERPNFVKPEFLKKIASLDPVQWLPQLRSQSIRIQRITEDTVTPGAAEERIEAVAPPNVKIEHYPDSGQLYRASSNGRIFQWLKDRLHPADTKPAVNSAAIPQPNSHPTDPGHE